MDVKKVRKQIKFLEDSIIEINIRIDRLKLDNYITIEAFEQYRKFNAGDLIENERYRKMRIDYFFKHGFAAYPVKKNGERYKLPAGNLKMFYTTQNPILNLQKDIENIEEKIYEKKLVLKELNKREYQRRKKRYKERAHNLLEEEKQKNNGCCIQFPPKRKLVLSYEPSKNWRSDNKKSLKSTKWTILRLAILERDNYSCVHCGWSSPNDLGKLQVNHFDGNYKNNAFSNLETICIHCHFIVHSGLSAGVWGVVEVYEKSNVSQEKIIFMTHNLREKGHDDEFIKEKCGLMNQVPWRQDYDYLSNKFGFISSEKRIFY